MGDEPVIRSRRRSRSEIEQLVAEYEASGLGRTEFCRTHGLSLGTLNRYCKRGQARSGVTGVGPWVAVEVAGGCFSSGASGTAGLTVILYGGRRIEIARGFDAETLERLIGRLGGVMHSFLARAAFCLEVQVANSATACRTRRLFPAVRPCQPGSSISALR